MTLLRRHYPDRASSAIRARRLLASHGALHRAAGPRALRLDLAIAAGQVPATGPAVARRTEASRPAGPATSCAATGWADRKWGAVGHCVAHDRVQHRRGCGHEIVADGCGAQKCHARAARPRSYRALNSVAPDSPAR